MKKNHLNLLLSICLSLSPVASFADSFEDQNSVDANQQSESVKYGKWNCTNGLALCNMNIAFDPSLRLGDHCVCKLPDVVDKNGESTPGPFIFGHVIRATDH